MDLGAVICRPKQPLCDRCPVADACMALAQGSAGGDSEHIRQRETAEHERNRLGAFGARDQVGGDDTADAKERSMAKRCKNAGKEQKQKGRSQGAERVAHQKHAHQNQQGLFTVHARQGKGYERRS